MDRKYFQKTKNIIVSYKDAGDISSIKNIFKKLANYVNKNLKTNKKNNAIILMEYISIECPYVLESFDAIEISENKNILCYILENEAHRNITNQWLYCYIKKTDLISSYVLEKISKQTLHTVISNEDMPLAWLTLKYLYNSREKYKQKLLYPSSNYENNNFSRYKEIEKNIKFFSEIVTGCDNLYHKNQGTLNFLLENGYDYSYISWDWSNITVTPQILDILGSTNIIYENGKPDDFNHHNLSNSISKKMPDKILDNKNFLDNLYNFILSKPNLWFNLDGKYTLLTDIKILHNTTMLNDIISLFDITKEFNNKSLLETFIIMSDVNNLDKVINWLGKNKNLELKQLRHLLEITKEVINYKNTVPTITLRKLKKFQILDNYGININNDKAIYLFILLSHYNNFEQLQYKELWLKKNILNKTLSSCDVYKSYRNKRVL